MCVYSYGGPPEFSYRRCSEAGHSKLCHHLTVRAEAKRPAISRRDEIREHGPRSFRTASLLAPEEVLAGARSEEN